MILLETWKNHPAAECCDQTFGTTFGTLFINDNNQFQTLPNVPNVKQCLRAREVENLWERDSKYAHTRTWGHGNIRHIRQSAQTPEMAFFFLPNVKIAHSANIRQAKNRGQSPAGRQS